MGGEVDNKLLPAEEPDGNDSPHHQPASHYPQLPQVIQRHSINNISQDNIEWGEGEGFAYRLEPGRKYGYGHKHVGEEKHGDENYLCNDSGGTPRADETAYGAAQGEEGEHAENYHPD